MTIEEAHLVHDLVDKREFYESVLRNNGAHYVSITVPLQNEKGEIRLVEMPMQAKEALFNWLSDEIAKIDHELEDY